MASGMGMIVARVLCAVVPAALLATFVNQNRDFLWPSPTEQGAVLLYEKGRYLGKAQAPLPQETLDRLRQRGRAMQQ